MTVPADEWFTDDDEAKEIFRRGDLVHRTADSWTPAVADLLTFLESVGYSSAPRHRGYDDAGRQVLTFLAGRSGADGWWMIHTDEGLGRLARLLRSYHDAVDDYRPGPDSTWAYATGAPGAGQIMCHGDFAPWNVVWAENGEPVGIIDWDFVVPAEPALDIFYALDWAVPFRDDQTCIDFHHFDRVPDRKHRIAVFLGAYGATELGDVVAGVADARRRISKGTRSLAGRGVQPQSDWVRDGLLERNEEQTAWIEDNAHLFR